MPTSDSGKSCDGENKCEGRIVGVDRTCNPQCEGRCIPKLSHAEMEALKTDYYARLKQSHPTSTYTLSKEASGVCSQWTNEKLPEEDDYCSFMMSEGKVSYGCVYFAPTK